MSNGRQRMLEIEVPNALLMRQSIWNQESEFQPPQLISQQHRAPYLIAGFQSDT